MLTVGLLLSGCSYVNRVAARLNSDGTLDFGTCDARNADSFEVEWIYASSSSSERPVSTTPIVGNVEKGDVFHLDASAPPDAWQSVYVHSVGESGAGIFGYFDAADLSNGEWVWNQSGTYFGTEDVEHCDLDEANAR